MSHESLIIVAGTDYSEHAARALQAALERARAAGNAELHVVHAVLAASPHATLPMAPVSGLGTVPVLTLEQQQAALLAYLDRHMAGEAVNGVLREGGAAGSGRGEVLRGGRSGG